MPRTHQRRPAASPALKSLLAGPEAPSLALRAVSYDSQQLSEVAPVNVADLAALRRPDAVLWVSVEGLGDGSVLQALAETFDLHPLAMEDVVSQRQRPKVEAYEQTVFVAFRILGADTRSTQLSMFFSHDVVITFQNGPSPIFDPVRAALLRPKAKLRQRGADFLAYSLADALIDNYFPLVDALSDEIDELQDEALMRPHPDLLVRINRAKRQLLRLRRAVWPLRDELRALMHLEQYVEAETVTYLRDCHDHALLLSDNVETLREMAAGLMDTYLSVVNQRMNEVMKTLTIISTIFIPLTFISGVYGMNFSSEASPWNMPELTWRYGYAAALTLMAAVALSFAGYMWRKGWFGALSETRISREDEPSAP